MRKTLLIAAIIVVAAVAAAITWYSGRRAAAPGGGAASPSGPALTARRMLPAFSLVDISGNRVESSRFQGRPTVINFFATWCPPCREEIPGFVAVYDRYRDRGLEIVGISLDTDTRGNLPAFVMANRIGYPILLGDIATVRAFGAGSGIPVTFFVGSDGAIRSMHVGYMDPGAFDREVQKIL